MGVNPSRKKAASRVTEFPGLRVRISGFTRAHFRRRISGATGTIADGYGHGFQRLRVRNSVVVEKDFRDLRGRISGVTDTGFRGCTSGSPGYGCGVSGLCVQISEERETYTHASLK